MPRIMPDPKKPSQVENLKTNSNYLRGTIQQSLTEPSPKFSSDDGTLLKSHGTYPQDDRDLRARLLAEKKEPAHSTMVRSKIPGGRMTWEQYLVHDDLATAYGNNTMRITTRQGIQFHGVLKKNLKTVIYKINQKLGTTLGACGDNVRNVMACPAPVTDRVRSQILQYAKTVSDTFLARSGAYHDIWLNGEILPHLPKPTPDGSEPIYGKTYLPRKFKIGIAFPDDNCIDVYTHDIGIVPEFSGDKLIGFNILAGGGLGMTHGIKDTYPRLGSPLCFVKPERLVDIVTAIVLVQRDFGNRSDRKYARMKYLIDSKGLDWFRAEVEKRFGAKTDAMHPVHWKAVENHLGWYSTGQGGQGTWFLGLPIENGRIKDEGTMRLKTGLRAFVERYKPQIDLTPQQDILFSPFSEAQKPEIEKFLSSFGIKLPHQVSVIRQDAIACPALPTCGLAITESERALPPVVDELEKILKDLGLANQRILTRMTGCPNGCARPSSAEIAFVGRTIGTYNVYLGGSLDGTRLNFLFAEKIPQAQLAQTLSPVLERYRKERLAGEGFGDYCFRMGQERLAGLAQTDPVKKK